MKQTTSILIAVTISLFIGVPTASAVDEGLIGKALYQIGLAEHLRNSILSSNCREYLTPSILGASGVRDYSQLKKQLVGLLSPRSRQEYSEFLASRKYQEQLRVTEDGYVSGRLAEYAKAGAPTAFACGVSFAKVSDVMGRAEIAYAEATRNR